MEWLINLYRTSDRFRAFVQAIEGGLLLGFLTATTNGLDFSKKGLTALGSAMAGGLVVAIRNYFLNRVNQPATVAGQKITEAANKPVDPPQSKP